MSIRLTTIQSSKNKGLDAAAEEFEEKINHFHKFELTPIKSTKKAREDLVEKRKEETLVLARAVQPGDYLILFDERGDSLNSKEFSEMIRQLQVQGTKRIHFLIGGAFGVDEALRQKANRTIKMSDFVLNHQVALIVALEQIYRAMTIIHNRPYHNE